MTQHTKMAGLRFSVCLWITFVTLLGPVCFALHEQLDLFTKCDSNGNKALSREELEQCSDIFPELNNPVQVDMLMKVFDINKDDSISSMEYVQVIESQRNNNPHDEVLVQGRDGTTKSIPRSELLDKMQDTMEGLNMNGKDGIEKEESGTMNMTEIESVNPQMAAFIKVAKWARLQLIALGHATEEGDLVHLQSWSASEKEENNDDDDDDFNDDADVKRNIFKSAPQSGLVSINMYNFTVGMAMSVGTPENNDVFLLEIEYNKAKYYRPHLVILELWKVVHGQEQSDVLSFSSSSSSAADGSPKKKKGLPEGRVKLTVPEPVVRTFGKSLRIIVENIVVNQFGSDLPTLCVASGITAICVLLIVFYRK